LIAILAEKKGNMLCVIMVTQENNPHELTRKATILSISNSYRNLYSIYIVQLKKYLSI
jgi:hypothetical protein